MLGMTLTTSATAGPCDASTPYTLDASKYGRFWAVAGNRYTLSVCNSSFNTMVYITNNFTIPGIINCDNDGCGTTNGPSSVSFVPVTSAQYRIYIFDGSCNTLYPAGTDVEVVITCSSGTPPPNDLPCGAIPLPEDGTPVQGDNEFATHSAAQVPGVGAPPSCPGALYQGADMWYTVTIPATGIISVCTEEFTICAGALQFYVATDCNGTFAPIAGTCTISGFTGPDSPPAITLNAASIGLAPGQLIYIRYWERNANENGTFAIRQCSDITTGITLGATGPLQILTAPGNDNIRLMGVGNGLAQILDLHGRLLRTVRVQADAPIPIHDLPTGVYILHFAGTHAEHTGRFVKF